MAEYYFTRMECRTVAYMEASGFSKALSELLKETVIARKARGMLYIETEATPRRVKEEMLKLGYLVAEQ